MRLFNRMVGAAMAKHHAEIVQGLEHFSGGISRRWTMCRAVFLMLAMIWGFVIVSGCPNRGGACANRTWNEVKFVCG
jgi:hypothetical protein